MLEKNDNAVTWVKSKYSTFLGDLGREIRQEVPNDPLVLEAYLGVYDDHINTLDYIGRNDGQVMLAAVAELMQSRHTNKQHETMSNRDLVDKVIEGIVERLIIMDCEVKPKNNRGRAWRAFKRSARTKEEIDKLIEERSSLPFVKPEHWQDRASCIGVDPELFFSDSSATIQTKLAKYVCQNCPVMEECLKESLTGDQGDVWGVWGGFTRDERKKFKFRVGY